MNKVYKWGIIGCGNVTELKSGPAYQKVDGFELVAVMRRNLEKAKDYALRHGVSKFYSNADDLINDPEIDAIYIATPPDSHCYYALKVAAASKVCCIEKPMATTYEESQLIYKAFEEKKLPVFIAYYRRSLPRFNQVKSWLDEHKIGTIRHVSWHLSKPASSIDLSKTYNWRTDSKIAPNGYFDDLASHGIDLLTYLLGDIKEAKGIAINQQGLYTAMDAVTGSWIHKSGITGSGSWNFGSNKREDIVQIYGDNGRINFSIFDDAAVVLEHGTHKESKTITNPENIQLYHVQNMKNHLFKNIEHPSTAKTALHTAWILDQITKNNN